VGETSAVSAPSAAAARAAPHVAVVAHARTIIVAPLPAQPNRKSRQYLIFSESADWDQEIGMSRLKRKEYEASLEPLQRELVDLTRWIATTGKRVVVVVEGRDSAGKGGAITAIRTGLVVAGCTSSDSIGAGLHVPEEGFAELDSCCTVLDIDVEVCWHRNRYRIQRYRKDGNKSTRSGWSWCLRIGRNLCVQLSGDREATKAEGRYTA
jgi:hypothetical protein